jgi:glycosyltransferase involved in cell wall biosynthesis
MQKCDFPFEIVLAEDCSTDGTREICREYAVKYPDVIHYVWSENNIGAVENEARAIRAAKGKYIALCEGDDYWTDAQKLQKQVDFMESHPEYSVTFHRYKIHYDDTDIWQEDNAG